MNEIILFVGVLIGSCTVTSYQSVKAQTDSSPFYTSIGERVHKGGVAVSRDLICGACRRLHRRCDHPDSFEKVHYGDYITIGNLGIFRVNDIMGETQYDKKTKRRVTIQNHFDMWVESLAEESKIKVQKHNVYVIKRTIR